MHTISEIKEILKQLAEKINTPDDLIPLFTGSDEIGTTFIELNENYYYYKAYDRDVLSINKSTTNFDELLYWVFSDITFMMSSRYESNNRDPKNNRRKAIFSFQLLLLAILSESWKTRREKEITEILITSPY